MKQEDLRKISDDLAQAAKFYITDACKDRLDGHVRAVFNAEVDARKLGDCIEIVQDPAALFLEAPPESDPDRRLLINNGKTRLERYISAKVTFDVDDLITAPDKFINAVDMELKTYEDEVPQYFPITPQPLWAVRPSITTGGDTCNGNFPPFDGDPIYTCSSDRITLRNMDGDVHVIPGMGHSELTINTGASSITIRDGSITGVTPSQLIEAMNKMENGR